MGNTGDTAQNKPIKYIAVSELISLLKEKHIRIGRTGSDDYNTLRYYTKIGLLPHMVRRFSNRENSVVGHYPISVFETLVAIESLKKKGFNNQQIKDTLQTSTKKEAVAEVIEQKPSMAQPLVDLKKEHSNENVSNNRYKYVLLFGLLLLFIASSVFIAGTSPHIFKSIETALNQYNHEFTYNFVHRFAPDLADKFWPQDVAQEAVENGDVLAEELPLPIGSDWRPQYQDYQTGAVFRDPWYATLRLENYAHQSIDGKSIGPDYIVAQENGRGVFYLQAGGNMYSDGSLNFSHGEFRNGLTTWGNTEIKGSLLASGGLSLPNGQLRIGDGKILLDSRSGNIFAQGELSIVGGATISGNVYLNADLLPQGIQSLGNTLHPWSESFIGTLYLGNQSISEGTLTGNWGFSNGSITNVGKVSTTAFQLTTDASLGYVLTSDTQGNATWSALSIPSNSPWVESGETISPVALSNRVAIGASNAGNARLYVSGLVGIGTTDPQTSFHIVATDGLIIPVGTTVQRPGSAQTGTIRFNSETGQFEGYSASSWGALGGGVVDQDQDTYILAETSAGTDNDQLLFYTFGQERLRIDAGGRVGIGTTNPNVWDTNIGELVDIKSQDSDKAAFIKIENADSSSFLGIWGGRVGDASPAILTYPTEDLRFGTWSSLIEPVTYTETMRITGSGNIGVGSTNPSSKVQIGNPSVAFINKGWTALTIAGTTTMTSSIAIVNTGVSSATQGSGFILYHDDGSAMASGDRLGYTLFGGNDGNVLQNSAGFAAYADGSWSSGSAPSKLVFQTTPSGSTTRQDRLTIRSNGYIGISTTNPGVTLDVSGAGRFSSTLTASDGFTLTAGALVLPNDAISDAMISNTLTASIFVGSGSTTNAIDLATNEIAGTLGLINGGTAADLSAASPGGLIYKAASALAATEALSGILQGNGSSVPTALIGSANYLPKWSTSAPYLTATSLIYDNGSNVGIGVTNPASRLDVSGTADGTDATLSIRNTAGTGRGLYIDSASSTNVAFLVQTPLSTDLNTGKVFTGSVAGDYYGRFMFYSDGKYGIGSGSADRDIFISRNSVNTLKISSDAGMGLGNLVVTGSVGVGTTSPSATLDINGDINLSGLGRLYMSGSLPNINFSGAFRAFGDSGGSTFEVLTASASRLYITNSGYVGLGTTTPSQKLQVFDGSILQDNPTNPVVIGGAALSLPYPSVGVDVQGNYAYMTFQDGSVATNRFRVIDITQPSVPSVVGGTGLSLPVIPGGIAVSGKYAYVILSQSSTGTDGFRVIDISNPTAPSIVGGDALSLPNGGKEIYISGNFAYVLFSQTSTNTDVFRIIDISNPTSPAVIGGSSLTLPSYATGIFVQGKYAYLSAFGTNGLRIIDVSDPTAPSIVGGSSLTLPNCTDVYVLGRYAYFSSSDGVQTQRFYVVNIANPASPARVDGNHLTSNGPNTDVWVAGKYAYVQGWTTTGGNTTRVLRMIDVSNPTYPVQVGGSNLTLPESGEGTIQAVGKYIYIAMANTLSATDSFRIIDASGIDAVSIYAGTIETGNLQILNSLSTQGSIQANSLSTGIGGVNSQGKLSVTGDTYLSGRVGIGTTGPDAKLEIVAVGANTEILRLTTERPWAFYQRSSGSSTALDLHSTVGGKAFQITNDNNEEIAEFYAGDLGENYISFAESRVRINDAGNVGIGTTNPIDKLSIEGDSNAELVARIYNPNSGNLSRAKVYVSSDVANGGLSANSSTYDAGIGLSQLANRISLYSSSGAGGIDIAALAADSDIRFYSGGVLTTNERMRITSTGQIGIGTTSPTNALQIANTTGIRSGTTSKYIDIFTSGGGNDINSSHTLHLNYGNNQAVSIGEGGTGNLLVSGRIGIATTDPQNSIHTVGSIRIDDSYGKNAILETISYGVGNGWIRATAGGTNDYMFEANDGANTLFKIGTTNRASYFNYGLKVGSLADAPIARLQVEGSGNGAGLNFLTRDNGGNALFSVSDSGNVGIGLTNPTYKLQMINTANHPINIQTDNNYGIRFADANDSQHGTIAVNSSQLIFTGFNNGTYFNTTGNIGMGTTTPNAKLDILKTSTQLRLSYSLAKYTDFSVDLNGMLVINPNGVSAAIFSDTSNTFLLPTTFTSAGDVGVSYDLVFTNQTIGNIKSYGPFSIEAGESFENNDLTLKTYGTGSLIVDAPGGLIVTSGGNLNLNTGALLILDADSGSDSYVTHDSVNNRLRYYVDGTEMFRMDTAGNESNGSIATSLSDVAENYPTMDKSLSAGDVIALVAEDSNYDKSTTSGYLVEKVNEKNQQQIIGVISSKPGLLLGGGSFQSEFCQLVNSGASGEAQAKAELLQKEKLLSTENITGIDDENITTKIDPVIEQAINDRIASCKAIRQVPVALSGRVPVKVDLSQGDIHAGDLLTPSTNNYGKAEKAMNAGFVIGRALEDSTLSKDTVMVLIFVSWWPGTSENGLVLQSSTGKPDLALTKEWGAIKINENLISLGKTQLSNTIIAGDLTIDGDINNAFGNLTFQNGKIIMTTDGSLYVTGKMTVAELVAQEYTVKTTDSNKKTLGANTSIGSITISKDQTKIVVPCGIIATTSKVFLTARAITNQTLAVTKILPQTSFTIELNAPAERDLIIDYWVVKVE